MGKLSLLSVGILIGIFIGCKRDSVIFPPAPQIEFVKITPKTVQEFGTFQITLRYKDGDGDLGGQPDTLYDLFLKDLRDSTRFPAGYDGLLRYNMPRFYEGPPQSIQGTIDILVPNIARLDPNAPQEAVVFEVYVVDRAGHESNHVRTDTAYIVP